MAARSSSSSPRLLPRSFARLKPRALQHRHARVLRIVRIRLRPLTEAEHAPARVPNHALVDAAIAEPVAHCPSIALAGNPARDRPRLPRVLSPILVHVLVPARANAKCVTTRGGTTSVPVQRDGAGLGAPWPRRSERSLLYTRSREAPSGSGARALTFASAGGDDFAFARAGAASEASGRSPCRRLRGNPQPTNRARHGAESQRSRGAEHANQNRRQDPRPARPSPSPENEGPAEAGPLPAI
jgi:hypothetical protein